MVSLPSVSVQLTQSVIPIGAALFILCEAEFACRIACRTTGAGRRHEEEPRPQAAAMRPADPPDEASPAMTLVLMVLGLFALILINVPIAVALAIGGDGHRHLPDPGLRPCC